MTNTIPSTYKAIIDSMRPELVRLFMQAAHGQEITHKVDQALKDLRARSLVDITGSPSEWNLQLTSLGKKIASYIPQAIVEHLLRINDHHSIANLKALLGGADDVKLTYQYTNILYLYGLVTDYKPPIALTPQGQAVALIFSQRDNADHIAEPVEKVSEPNEPTAAELVEPSQQAPAPAQPADDRAALLAEIETLRKALLEAAESSNQAARREIPKENHKALKLNANQLQVIRNQSNATAERAARAERELASIREENAKLKAELDGFLSQNKKDNEQLLEIAIENDQADAVRIQLAADLAAANAKIDTLNMQIDRMSLNHKRQLDAKSEEITRMTNQLDSANRRAERAETDIKTVQATASRWQQEHSAITALLKLLTPDDKPTYRVVENATAQTLAEMECAGWERVLMQFDSGSLRVVYRHAGGEKPQPAKTAANYAHTPARPAPTPN